jgi:hypothetical protein
LRRFAEAAMSRTCVTCGRAFSYGDRFAQTVAYACSNDARGVRVHLFTVVFCAPACGDAMWADLERDGTADLVSVCGLAVAAGGERKELRHALMGRAVMKGRARQYTGAQCAHCSARHVQGVPPYRQCSRCKSALYCSDECQREHWRDGGHATACKPREAVLRAQDLVDALPLSS